MYLFKLGNCNILHETVSEINENIESSDKHSTTPIRTSTHTLPAKSFATIDSKSREIGSVKGEIEPRELATERSMAATQIGHLQIVNGHEHDADVGIGQTLRRTAEGRGLHSKRIDAERRLSSRASFANCGFAMVNSCAVHGVVLRWISVEVFAGLMRKFFLFIDFFLMGIQRLVRMDSKLLLSLKLYHKNDNTIKFVYR